MLVCQCVHRLKCSPEILFSIFVFTWKLRNLHFIFLITFTSLFSGHLYFCYEGLWRRSFSLLSFTSLCKVCHNTGSHLPVFSRNLAYFMQCISNANVMGIGVRIISLLVCFSFELQLNWFSLLRSRKFYIRRNNNYVFFIWCKLVGCIYTHLSYLKPN